MTNPTTVPDPYEGDRGLPLDPGMPVTGSSTGVGSTGGGFGDFSGSSYTSAGTPGQSGSTTDVAKGEAAHAKDAAAGAAQQVASTAKGELGNVTSEVGSQAKNLVDQARVQVREQVSSQQSRLAEGVHSIAKELGSMGSGGDSPGVVADLAQQASQKVGAIGHWLENREPADLLDEARRYARRKPGMFLMGSALLGAVVGRLTRNAAAVAKDEKQAAASGSYGDSGYVAAGTYGTVPTSDTAYGSATGYSDTSYTSSSYTVPATGYASPTSDFGTIPADPTTPGYGSRGDVTP